MLVILHIQIQTSFDPYKLQLATAMLHPLRRFTTDSSGRTRTAQRRLSTTYDVCGEAGKLAKPKVDEALAQVPS